MKKYWMKLDGVDDAQLVGGKSYQMGKLIQVCDYTPNGVAITTELLCEFLAQVGISDERLQNAIVLEQQAIEEIRSALKNEKWPQQVVDILREVYSNFDKSVCVRSSAVSEDGKSHSYAGVYRSNINIRTFGEFLWAVRDCWLSAFDENAVAYASMVHESLSLMALTVQPLIHSIKSGIAVKDGDILTISATYGQGQGAVSGQIPCDTYKINRKGETIVENIAMKNCCYLEHIDNYPVRLDSVYRLWDDGFSQGFYVSDTDDRNAMLFCSIFNDEHTRPGKPALTLEQKERLSKELFRLAELFGGNWDFEWAITDDSKIHILQARPLLSTLETEEHVAVVSSPDAFVTGVPISKGVVTGKVKKINNDEDMRYVEKGDIVAIDWIPESCISVLSVAGGLIIGETSVISHCAIIAREWGIPCVGGIDKDVLIDGNTYCIDGASGAIKIVDIENMTESKIVSDSRIKIDYLNILFWLVSSVDDIMVDGQSEQYCIDRLHEFCNEYDICNGVNMWGIADCHLEYENADQIYRSLCSAAYRYLKSNNLEIRLSEDDLCYMQG